MATFLDFLKNNCYSGWITALVALIGLFVTIFIHVKGDKKIRIEKKQKRYEFRNISFNFLASIIRDYRMSTEHFPITQGVGIDKLIEDYGQKLAKHEPFMTYLERKKYRNYIQLARNYNNHWLELSKVNKNRQIVAAVISERKNLLKQINWLGNKIGRQKEVKKLQDDYE